MKFRIKVMMDKNGNFIYYPQRLFLRIFWIPIDIKGLDYHKRFYYEDFAKKHIQNAKIVLNSKDKKTQYIIDL